MLSPWLIIVCGVIVLANGLVAGAFFAFSDFVMKALRNTNPAAAIEAMQVINRKVYGSIFLALFIGLAPVLFAMAVYAALSLTGPAVMWIVAGGAVYVVGVFLVTLLCNVPMNKKLDAMDYTTDEATAYWQTYLSRWTFWNHVRTAASLASMVCFLVGVTV